MGRRWLDDASAADLGRLDVAAIERVRAEAWPEAANADELHDALLGLGFVTPDEVDRQPIVARTARFARARSAASTCVLASAKMAVARQTHGRMWVAAERLPQFHAVYPNARLDAADRRARGVQQSAHGLATMR